MSLTLYKNKEIVWTAMYHLMKGGTFFVNVHNTVGASSPPANDADEADWYPSGAIYTYWLGSDYSLGERLVNIFLYQVIRHMIRPSRTGQIILKFHLW